MNERYAHHLQCLAELGVRREYAKNDLIIDEGRSNDEIYIVQSGRVEVFSTAEVIHGDELEKRKMVLVEHGPGHSVGEMSLDGEVRSASVRALEPTVCAMVNRESLRGYLLENPEFGLLLLEEIIGRLRRATEFLKSISLLEVAPRIEFLLKHLARKIEGDWVVPVQLSRDAIAKRVGASRAAASEVVKQLEAEGSLDFGSRPVRLLGRLARELETNHRRLG